MEIEIIKTVGGVILGIIMTNCLFSNPNFGMIIIGSLYCLGLIYGFRIIASKVVRLISSLLKLSAVSLIFRNIFALFLFLFAVPVSLAIILTVGSIIGLAVWGKTVFCLLGSSVNNTSKGKFQLRKKPLLYHSEEFDYDFSQSNHESANFNKSYSSQGTDYANDDFSF